MNKIKLDVSAYDLTNTKAVGRFTNMVEGAVAKYPSLPYAFSAYHAALAYHLFNTEGADQLAVTMCRKYMEQVYAKLDAGLRPDIARDSYLHSGREVTDLMVTLDKCGHLVPEEEAAGWMAFAKQTVFNLTNFQLSNWNGIPDKYNGWARDKPGNNYFYSHLAAIGTYLLMSEDDRAPMNARIAMLKDYFGPFKDGGSSEGTGYGQAQAGLFSFAKWWGDSTGEVIQEVVEHANDTIKYWVHATVPTMDEVMPLGDQSRVSRHYMFDGDRNLVLNAMSLATDESAKAIGRWWLSKITHTQMNAGNYCHLDMLDHKGEAIAPTELVYHAKGSGHRFERTSWDNDALYFCIAGGRNDESHDHDDQGAISIFHLDWLTVTRNIDTHSGIRGEPEYNNAPLFRASDGKTISQYAYGLCELTELPNTIIANMDNVYKDIYGIKCKRTITRNNSSFRIQDVYSANAGITGHFILNTISHKPTLNGNVITAGPVTYTIIKPINPDISIIDWAEENPDDYLRPGWKFEVSGGNGEYDVLVDIDMTGSGPEPEPTPDPEEEVDPPEPEEDEVIVPPEKALTSIPVFPDEVKWIHIAKRGQDNAKVVRGGSWHSYGESEWVKVEDLRLDDLVGTCVLSTDGKVCYGITGVGTTSTLRVWEEVRYLKPTQEVHCSTGVPFNLSSRDGAAPAMSVYVTYISEGTTEPETPVIEEPIVEDVKVEELQAEIAALKVELAIAKADLVTKDHQISEAEGLIGTIEAELQAATTKIEGIKTALNVLLTF